MPGYLYACLSCTHVSMCVYTCKHMNGMHPCWHACVYADVHGCVHACMCVYTYTIFLHVHLKEKRFIMHTSLFSLSDSTQKDINEPIK